jgi:hypothetical protein
VVSVKAPEEHAGKVEAIMDDAMPIDRDARLASYGAEGWTEFDAKAPPYGGATPSSRRPQFPVDASEINVGGLFY